MNRVALLLSFAVFSCSVLASPEGSDYRKYLRTRPTQHPSEVHVEEVLEVFKTKNRPPAYGVYNINVNWFLANERLMRDKSMKTTTSTTARPSTWQTIAAVDARSTYPTPTRDNVNPDYTNPFSPSVSVTKYPASVTTPTIIIQEGTQKARRMQWQTSEAVTDMPESTTEEDDAYQYSNEDYFEE
ncbi:uncharacterized protein LOC129762117 [Toxorhynchites rutilus septentrionalis]|uniref:uncharacterized protein LOC129762117 n=1 Tax=Toxorhynchites rutilus septentrionalis TaxID=329112 RepID=UPI002478382B|nr:uncharacterized protein LOC129762117 [Toxorhynchites rutilus septentrionalis]